MVIKIRGLPLTLIVGLVASSSAFATATIVIQNGDDPNVGFNDPTPVSPIGGNNGTTLGQQRLNVFQAAAGVWAATLTSGPTITLKPKWAPLTCTANAGTLGSAGSQSLIGNFPNAPFINTWYSIALANALAGSDQNGPTEEITATFNLNVGTSPSFSSFHWYFCLYKKPGTSDANLFTGLLHQFAHGLE